MADGNKPDSRQRNFSFSSETRVRRWFGDEILDHSPGAARMEFLSSGRAPFLQGHDQRMVLGVIESASIKSKVGRGVVRFSRKQLAEDVMRDVDDGIQINTSVGYRVHEMVLESTKDGKDTYRITDWEPLEASLVGIPADSSVGMGRAAEAQVLEVREARASSSVQTTPAQNADRRATMADQVTAAAGASAESPSNSGAGEGVETRGVVVTGGAAPMAVQLEKQRQSVIRKWCQTDAIQDNVRDQWIHSGTNLDEVGDQIVLIKAERQRNVRPQTEIGMTNREADQFSIRKAIVACGTQNWTGAGMEAQASQAVAQKLGRVHENNKFFIPMEVQQRAVPNPVEALLYGLQRQLGQLAVRDLTVASAASAGFLVGTQNMSFIELLRNLSVLGRMGVFVMGGLQGNLTIPKQTGSGAVTWLANEAASISEINQTFTQIALSPKNVGGYTEISRQLLLQSNPSAETLVMADLAAVVGLAIDLSGISGPGSGGQPTGIVNTAGIGSVTGTSLDYADIIEFQTDTATGNALFQSSGYATTPVVAGLLKQRVKFPSTASPIWEGQLLEGQIDAYKAMASNQLAAASMLFGNFATVIQAEWGVLEVEVNPFANFPAGIVGVRAIASIDFGVRYPTAFSLATTIT